MTAARPVEPLTGPVEATVAVPGSKSIANRALVCAALAEGTSTLTNVPDGDDTTLMVGALQALGATVAADGPQVEVISVADVASIGPATVDAGLAGTTSRFVTALAALGSSPVTIDGLPALRRRPFAALHDALSQIGVTISAAEPGHLPVTVTGPPTAGTATIRGDVSSQYVTALMLIGPYLPDGLRLSLSSPLVSRPYVEMTAAVMAQFGAEPPEVGDTAIRVHAGRYRATRLAIEPDASSASYPMAVAAVRGGSVTIDGLGERSLQGDARFADLLASMGCWVERGPDFTRVGREPDMPLQGIDVDMSDVSDLVPTLAAVALFADTPSRIRGVGFIRGKESDRIGDLAGELRAIGADVDALDDGLLIRPSAELVRGGTVATHHDHRLAMAFGVIGSIVPGITVTDPDVVSKSWPGFWSMLDALARR